MMSQRNPAYSKPILNVNKNLQENFDQQNQSDLENLQQNNKDLDNQIRMLEMQKQLESEQNKINNEFKAQEISVYKEIINEVQQQYNERQQKKELKIRQLQQQIKDTQNRKQMTEQKLESINVEIQEFQNSIKGQNTQSGRLKIYLSNSENSYRHNTCQTQAYLTNSGLITCDRSCHLINKQVDHWYFDIEKNEVIYIDQPWQFKQYKFKMIFNEMILIDLVENCLHKNFIYGQERDDFFQSITKSSIYKKLLRAK